MYTTTIVSAFISNINNHKDIEKYIEHGMHLLELDIPKIIYVDDMTYTILNNITYPKNITKLIRCNKEDIYLYNYINDISQFNINTNNCNKDTLEYMCIMCNKTEWMKTSIQSNIFNTEQFIWIDFGINHVIKCSDDEFIQKIIHMCSKTYNNVRIGSIWDINYNRDMNIYKDILWYFAGGIFGGDSKSLIKFANLVKEKCIRIITEHNTLFWEVNVWWIIYKENVELFSLYKCDHNESILSNY